MAFIDIKHRGIRELEHGLGQLRSKAIPYAVRDTLNDFAHHTAQMAKKQVRTQLTIRNHWTLKGIQFERARIGAIARMESATGSLDEYMGKQEYGGTQRAKGGAMAKPIATARSSREGDSSYPRKRNTIASLSRRAIKTSDIPGIKRSKSRAQRNLITVKWARKHKRKFVYMDMARNKGLMQIPAGKKTRINMLHSLSRKSVRTPAKPWLQPSVMSALPALTEFYRDNLIRQARMFT